MVVPVRLRVRHKQISSELLHKESMSEFAPPTQLDLTRDLLARAAEIKDGIADAFETEAAAALELAERAATVFKYLRLDNVQQKDLGESEIPHRLIAKRERSALRQQITEFVLLGEDGALRSYRTGDKGEGAQPLSLWKPTPDTAIVSPLEVFRTLVQAVYTAYHGLQFNSAVIQRRARLASASNPHTRGETVQSIALRGKERKAHTLLALLYMYTTTGGDSSTKSWIHVNAGLLGMRMSELNDALTKLREIGYVSGTDSAATLSLTGIEAAEAALMHPTDGSIYLPSVEEVFGGAYPDRAE